MPTFVYVIISIIFWALWSIFTKLALRTIHPFMQQFTQYCVSVIIGIIYLIIIQRNDYKWNATGIMWALIAALCTLTASVSYMFATSNKEVSFILPIANTYPILSCILAIAFLGETFTIYKLVGVLLTIAGVIVISFSK